MQKKRKAPPSLLPLNVRLDHELVRELRLLSAQRRADGDEPWQIQKIVDEALRAWMRKNNSK